MITHRRLLTACLLLRRRVVDDLRLREELAVDFSQVGHVEEIKPRAKVSELLATHVVAHDQLVNAVLQVAFFILLVVFRPVDVTTVAFETRFRVPETLVATRVEQEESVVDERPPFNAITTQG